MTVLTQHFRTVFWEDDAAVLLDQRLLPVREVYNRYRDVDGMADAIRDMVVRGAPAIGIAAAFGVVLAARQASGDREAIRRSCAQLAATRPTAVNLFWAIERMKRRMDRDGPSVSALLDEAQRILSEDIAACRTLGDLGAAFIPDGATVLTHCNAGALATGGWGTALGVIRSAVAAGKNIRVIADETRPRLQGACLTAWELSRDGIDVTVIADNAAASLMARGQISAVVVGADRIAANGDVCNKVGTYSVALGARAAGVPFYVAAPVSTIDRACAHGGLIPIEERAAEEVTLIDGVRLVAEGVPALNPAFDVTPAHLVSAIFTEAGVFEGDYGKSFSRMDAQSAAER